MKIEPDESEKKDNQEDYPIKTIQIDPNDNVVSLSFNNNIKAKYGLPFTAKNTADFLMTQVNASGTEDGEEWTFSVKLAEKSNQVQLRFENPKELLQIAEVLKGFKFISEKTASAIIASNNFSDCDAVLPVPRIT